MLIKLGIIAGIVILGGMIFYNEIGNIFPSTTTVVNDALTDDINSLAPEHLIPYKNASMTRSAWQATP